MKNNAFLGTGWSFPPSFGRASQEVELSQNEQDIHQSLMILFSTSPGERIMNPDYGCQLNRFMFAELTQTTLTGIEFEVRRAILFFEPRIKLQGIKLSPSPEVGKLLIDLEYLIISTNTRNNMVYPFYLHEGTLVDPSMLPPSN